MIKRILLALALAASLGGAVIGCNTPASTSTPSVTIPSTAPVTPSTAPVGSDSMGASPSPSAS